jgi:WD40 repeat protein
MTSFHQGKQKFAIGSTQGQVIVFDIRSATKWRILDGHTGAISAVGFDQTGKYLCSYSATDCTVRVWHITGGGVTGVSGPTVIHGNSAGPTSILGGLLGSTGGKCVQVKQLGTIDEDKAVNGIKHPFNMVYRINGVKIRWTSENDILLVRENGQGIQIRL